MFKTSVVSHIPNVITCPNAFTWGSLYYIKTMGMIEMVKPIKELKPFMCIDRVYVWRPKDVIEYAINNNLKVGSVAYDAMVRLWIEIVKPNSIFSMFGELPTYDEYNKVVVDDDGNMSKCNFKDTEWGIYTVSEIVDGRCTIYTHTNLGNNIISRNYEV